jgi:hypothetical protein
MTEEWAEAFQGQWGNKKMSGLKTRGNKDEDRGFTCGELDASGRADYPWSAVRSSKDARPYLNAETQRETGDRMIG